MNRRLAPAFATMALLCLVLSACGNKGPLVLPDKPADGTATEGSTAQPTADEAKTPGR